MNDEQNLIIEFLKLQEKKGFFYTVEDVLNFLAVNDDHRIVLSNALQSLIWSDRHCMVEQDMITGALKLRIQALT